MSKKSKISIYDWAVEHNPSLIDEWNFVKNIYLGFDIREIAYGSKKKVWWKCSICSNEWEMRPNDRTSSAQGCSVCAKINRGILYSRVCAKNNPLTGHSLWLSRLRYEWGYSKNDGLKPEDVSYGSTRKVWWECSVCGYEWEASVNGRTSGHGCPSCAGKVVTDKNNLFVVRPDIAVSWWGGNSVLPLELTTNNSKKIGWVCGCGNIYFCKVSDRTRGDGKDIRCCRECSSKSLSRHLSRKSSEKGSLADLYPGIAKEWDFDSNGDRTPDTVSPGSSLRVSWVCSVCGFRWETSIYNKIKYNCPQCSSKKFVSNRETSWLDCEEKKLGRAISRQVYVSGLKVDGYDPETDTVYEFLGNYWHGNPNIFYQEDVNLHRNITFGELFDKTLERLVFLRSCQHNLSIMWED